MQSISIARAKAHFSEIIKRVEAGESIEITRRGRPIARLTPVMIPRQPIDMDALRAFTEHMTPCELSAADLVRAMRDDGC